MNQYVVKIKLIFSWIREFYIKSIYITSAQRDFNDFLFEIKKSCEYSPLGNENVLLVPLINDLGTMKIVTQIAYKMASEENLIIKYFYVETGVDRKILRNSKIGFRISQFLIYNSLLLWKLCRIYKIKKSDIIISNYFLPSIQKNIIAIKPLKECLLGIKENKIHLGELIYDTYLRFRAKPNIDFNDECLADIIDYSKKLNQIWQDGLLKYKIKMLLVPYLAYHHWGIPAYNCLNNGINVITFGSFNYIFSKPSISHPYHSKNFHTYPEKFLLVSNKEEKINLAKEVLHKRLGGFIDSGTSYMKRSAFSDSSEEFSPPENSKWCVVFLHCFFDSPHIYGKSLFPDFHEWIVHIFNQAIKNKDTIYYIKEHPNALKENDAVILAFKDQYRVHTNIIFLSSQISNKQISAKKPQAIFTVYGTVAHEFAALKIPVIVAGENPQSMYGFTHMPKTVAEFDYFLDSIGNFGLPNTYNEDEIYEFFYMHYMYYSSKYDSTNFEKIFDINNGIIYLPSNIPFKDLIYG